MSKEENSMVELIVGKKGKGKTKVLLDKVNGAIKEANGSIVYLDKSTKHMYELNNKVRLIDVSVYPIKNADEFVGFVCGIISQDHDLEQVYLDSFLTTAKLEGKDVTGTLEQLNAVGEKFNVKFVVSMSLDKEEIPESLQELQEQLTEADAPYVFTSRSSLPIWERNDPETYQWFSETYELDQTFPYYEEEFQFYRKK
mgnify:CR=1 FL=1